jgi:hypothetical protein
MRSRHLPLAEIVDACHQGAPGSERKLKFPRLAAAVVKCCSTLMSITRTPSPELLDWQRSRLVEFVVQFDLIYGEGDFASDAEYTTPGLIALALRGAQLIGFEGAWLEQFFEHEFGLAGTNDGELETALSLPMLLDVEKRVRCAAGGRN